MSNKTRCFDRSHLQNWPRILRDCRVVFTPLKMPTEFKALKLENKKKSFEMENNNYSAETVIMGAGLAGLSAGYILTKANRHAVILESDSEVGGLSKTISWQGFRFDLGGHRFLTEDEEIERFVKNILQQDYLTVSRSSQIHLLNRYFDYPFKPKNLFFGLGLGLSLRIIFDFSLEQIRRKINPKNPISLKDWVKQHFGQKMYDIYFKPYSEKVWGIKCEEISQEWVAQRIKGLSLGTAIKDSFFKFRRKKIPTLADKFIYPTQGVGQISKNLEALICKKNSILTSTRITGVIHDGSNIQALRFQNGSLSGLIKGTQFISSIPLTSLIRLMDPPVPDRILNSADRLRFRDLVIVTLMINRDRVTNLSWLYFPQKETPWGRIHEPKNWSPDMAPKGKTHLVVEFFCFQGHSTWTSKDEDLVKTTASYLEKLGLIRQSEVFDSRVVHVPNAYPILTVGYEKDFHIIRDYLKKFKNMQTVGRGGGFRYHNMDQVIRAGIESAESIMEKKQVNSPLAGA